MSNGKRKSYLSIYLRKYACNQLQQQQQNVNCLSKLRIIDFFPIAQRALFCAHTEATVTDRVRVSAARLDPAAPTNAPDPLQQPASHPPRPPLPPPPSRPVYKTVRANDLISQICFFFGGVGHKS